MTTVRQALLRNRLPATGQAWEPLLYPRKFNNLTAFVPLNFYYRGLTFCVKPIILIYMKETDIAWAAGFFDGEGSISRKSQDSLVIRIGQKVPEPLEHFIEIFKLSHIASHTGKYKKADYRWYGIAIYGEAARAILRLMLPYLTVKKDKALRALNERTTRIRDDKRIWLISYFRGKGHSFTTIGRMLNISRQRAHQIYSQRPKPLILENQQSSYLNLFYK